MAFESLSDKLQNVFKGLRGKGRLSEEDVKLAMKEVRMALLEADVSYKVVKDFVKTVQERAIGEDVIGGLNPAQTVIKIVDDEMTKLMGGKAVEIELRPGMDVTVIMMCGLQGSGKTTTAAKLAGRLKKEGKVPLLVACDVYRPAAIDQLKVNAEKVEVECFSMGTGEPVVEIARHAVAYAKQSSKNVVILDTAGRLQIDEKLMQELVNIKETVEVHYSFLVVDAMTGQDAVNVATQFDEKVGIDGLVLSKLDGDTRGGAALSAKAVTGKPIYYAGLGEKLTDLDIFYPDRMASRILGMGDVLTLIDKAVEANAQRDLEADRAMVGKLRKGKLDFNMYLESMKQIRGMGGIMGVMNMLPGFGQMKIGEEDLPDEQQLARIEAIVLSMTPAERENPKLMNPKRKARIAAGSGNSIADVNRFVKQFEQAQKMMKQMPGMFGGRRKGGFGGLGALRGLGGLGGMKGL
ncbi:MAG: signal recognition particle protein [Butyrivibrio sp.]|nr:signal recognition particle protein [Butyrivibrio sp.]